MKIRSLGFLALSLLACAPLPEDTGGLSQAGGADPDTVYVWIDPSWGRSDSIQILDEMVRLRPVGRRFVMALTIESAYLRVDGRFRQLRRMGSGDNPAFADGEMMISTKGGELTVETRSSGRTGPCMAEA